MIIIQPHDILLFIMKITVSILILTLGSDYHRQRILRLYSILLNIIEIKYVCRNTLKSYKATSQHDDVYNLKNNVRRR